MLHFKSSNWTTMDLMSRRINEIFSHSLNPDSRWNKRIWSFVWSLPSCSFVVIVMSIQEGHTDNFFFFVFYPGLHEIDIKNKTRDDEWNSFSQKRFLYECRRKTALMMVRLFFSIVRRLDKSGFLRHVAYK